VISLGESAITVVGVTAPATLRLCRNFAFSKISKQSQHKTCSVLSITVNVTKSLECDPERNKKANGNLVKTKVIF